MKAFKKKLRNLILRPIYRPTAYVFNRLGYKIVRKSDDFQEAIEGHLKPSPEDSFVARKLLLSPRTSPFNLALLISHLESKSLKGFFKHPMSSIGTRICIPSSLKTQFLSALADFCATEGASLKYSVSKKYLDLIDVSTFIKNLSSYEKSSMRLSSLRSQEVFDIFVEFWVEHDDYYHAPSPNLISRRLWKSTIKEHDLLSPGRIHDLSEALNYPHGNLVTFPIDIVFTWVNSDDPDWQKMYAKYAPQVITDGSSKSRFHSRDELMYALRSWDKYASFIRKIFVVSNCAPPPWLDLTNKRIEWISHEAILPSSALPTFSSHAIETSLHKIPGIANHFIYSNDDFLLTRTAYPTDFFYANGIIKVRVEPYGMVNGSPEAGHPDYLNAARNSNRLIEQTFHRSTTQLVTHSPQPLRKDILDEIERKFPDELAVTSHNKFRKLDDIALTGYMHAHYSMLTGNAVFDATPVRLIQQNHNFKVMLSDLISAKDSGDKNLPLSICLNDGADSHLNNEWNEAVANFLQSFFPDKSTLEKRS